MIPINKKQEVLYKLGGLNITELRVLKDQFRTKTDLSKKFYYTSSTYWRGYTTVYIQSGKVLEKFMVKKEKGNDAPRGGKDGDYIIFKNTKQNREILYILKIGIELVMNTEDRDEQSV
ncbi:hypothetical protein [Petrocella sp. FN5]|uniref:hypothetical protein n=1 Tax=Petrocella sp. FN5 TaxID=3032002 RepID=UPI0023DC1B18|nr:hypothetical protein [Petrocella sp. FN5]MDF1618779.1 hypothetical protein [Petrocella sp. FN5]